MAAENPAVLRTLHRQGYGALHPAAGLSALHKALTTALHSNLLVSLFEWPVFLKGADPLWPGIDHS